MGLRTAAELLIRRATGINHLLCCEDLPRTGPFVAISCGPCDDTSNLLAILTEVLCQAVSELLFTSSNCVE
ncbi:hypothetical protein BgiMline_018645 [Biomphalaria glabrata]|nr:hypothetical protein BgiMline_006257 [Biomphalaria glabrata]KAI8791101.1 hypothetical protein BgiBS90_009025 [Biomphalaria glabrata]